MKTIKPQTTNRTFYDEVMEQIQQDRIDKLTRWYLNQPKPKSPSGTYKIADKISSEVKKALDKIV